MLLPTPLPRHHAAFEDMSRDDVDLLLASARTLREAAAARTVNAWLGGRKLGLLRCERAEGSSDAALGDADAARFRRAAEALGAHVACVRVSPSTLGAPGQPRDTALLLGRLYDAIECQGLPPGCVQHLASEAGVPVYHGLATARHPSYRLLSLLDAEAPLEDNWHCLLQAILLCSIA